MATTATQATNATDDPIAAFDAAVRQRLPQHRTPSYEDRMAAVAAVAAAQPELHRAYLLATNPGSRQQRLIGEKLG